MKRTSYKLLIFALAAIIGWTGCTREDLIDLTPEFSLDALENPSSMEEVEQVLLGTYAGFRAGAYYGSGSGTGNGWGMMADVLSDNLYETLESLANSRTMADWLYTADEGQVSAMYSAPYVVISRANIVLRDADKFVTGTNGKVANRLKGQAYAIRAMAHFDLLRYFGNSYDRNSTSELALPYITEFAVSTTIKPSRLNNKEYYDKILADLTQAVTLLGDVDKEINPAAGLTRPYMDRAAVYAIQARVYLYAQMWQEAITASTNAINIRPLVNLNQSAFTGMYRQTGAGEMIWNVQFEAGQSGPTFLVYFVTSGQRSYFRPALEVATPAGTSGLVQNNDIRYNAFFTNVAGELALSKYQGKGADLNGNANYIAFRTGEMYLIRAEAYARNTPANEALALADLNTLRAARINGYTPEVGLGGTALLTAIADERRRELIGEGHRFFDLKRTTRTVVRGSTCGNTAISPAGDCELMPTDREWNLPIPQVVINVNPNIIQNPNY